VNRESIDLMLQYNKWANSRLMKAVESLQSMQFEQLREKLAHILFWEEIWLMRWKGNSPGEVPGAAELPDFSAFEKRWQEHYLDVRNFFSKISDEELKEVISYDNFQGEEWSYVLWRMIFHAVNHSTHHRGQVATLLRQFNIDPPRLDFIAFLDEGAAEPATAKTENPWA
jgi:uncharacterized damage-inducible protein DinB